MYVTRHMSSLRRSPESLKSPPKEGPNSGFLVLSDEELETSNCFGLMQKLTEALPFPQNKDLAVVFPTRDSSSSYVEVLFVPVLDQPLSSNRYYVIHRRGKHKGEASTSAKEENIGTSRCCMFLEDVAPRLLDPENTYQQVEIVHEENSGFTAESVPTDGFPPRFLRRKYWWVKISRPCHYYLEEASGLNSTLRANLPCLNFSPSSEISEPILVGKWYCPFMFVREHGMKPKNQMELSTFYEMTLEQRWEMIFGCENPKYDAKTVYIDVMVSGEEVYVATKKAIRDERNLEKGVIWFRSCDGIEGEEVSRVGLSIQIMERMKWEQERVGWFEVGDKKQVRVERNEEFEGTSSGWSKFGCYALVERFVLKRMDKTIVLTYDFKHTHQIRCKWE